MRLVKMPPPGRTKLPKNAMSSFLQYQIEKVTLRAVTHRVRDYVYGSGSLEGLIP